MESRTLSVGLWPYTWKPQSTCDRGVRLPKVSGELGAEPECQGKSLCRSSLTTGDDRSSWRSWLPEWLRQFVSRRCRHQLILSGLRGTRQWFSNTTNIARTLSALQVLTAEFTQSSYDNTVLTIELINEPFPFTPTELGVLQSFYESAYDSVRSASQQSSIVVAIDEAFQGLAAWENFMLAPTYADVALDTVS
jgi:hypothetical protein